MGILPMSLLLPFLLPFLSEKKKKKKNMGKMPMLHEDMARMAMLH
jgi:uncharacterized protein YneF (UPF0154 family)